ncbi:TOMM precursor leader peptide-binding protein [Actinophytocola sp.]|uniref:TOMM precursor leader peptide-binding protein n=1 Tax=Actinophytocola sp. TaxID=1872138 RepID=UPI003D6AD165
MDPTLPRRPRVAGDLAVLRRRPDEIQIGLDPRLAAVASGLPEPVVAAVARLTGRQRAEDVLAGAGEHREAMGELLAALTARGLVDDAARQAGPLPGRLAGDVSAAAVRGTVEVGRPDSPAARRGLAVSVHGDGRLAVSVAALLASVGVGWVHVRAGGTVRPEDTGTGYLADDVGRRRAAAAREAVRRADATVRTGPFRVDRGPDLVLLTDAVVPEPSRVAALTSAGVPHLSVRLRDGTGIVGPLVVPGLTSCLRCADLQRCDRDECWPQLAAQLAGKVQQADLASTQATAAFAVGQALAATRWLKGSSGPPATCNATVELDVYSTDVRHRAWPAHPACACGAAVRCANLAADSIEKLRQSRRDGDAS